MTRAVVDTNVLVSGVIASHSAPRRILEAWHAGRFTLVASEATIAEVMGVLRFGSLQRCWPQGTEWWQWSNGLPRTVSSIQY